jgi:hypothetical protein
MPEQSVQSRMVLAAAAGLLGWGVGLICSWLPDRIMGLDGCAWRVPRTCLYLIR